MKFRFHFFRKGFFDRPSSFYSTPKSIIANPMFSNQLDKCFSFVGIFNFPLSAYRNSKCFLDGIMAFVDPINNHFCFHSSFFFPFFCCKRFTIPLISPSPTRISHLLGLCFPSHISRFVGRIIINATNTPLPTKSGGGANVFIKLFDGIPPFFTNGNTPAAIMGILNIIRIIATAHHVIVGNPYFAMRKAVSFSVESVLYDTPTASRVSVLKVSNRDGNRISTIAPTKTPSFLRRCTTRAWNVFHKRQFASGWFDWRFGRIFHAPTIA